MKDWHFFGLSLPLWVIATCVADSLWLSIPFSVNAGLSGALMMLADPKK